MTNIITAALLAAMAQVESGSNPRAIGDGGKAVGILQIHRCVVRDVNRIHGTNYTHRDAHDPTKARAMAFLYLSYYCTEQRMGRKPTQEDVARVWVGGPIGYRRQCTRIYWDKVKEIL